MANAWITFLTKYYQDRKKKQPGYSYSDAMKDAKIEYDKTKGTSHTKSPKKGKKMRGGSGYGGYSPLANAASVNHSTGSLVGGQDMPQAAPTHKGGAVENNAGSVPDTEDPENPIKGGKKSRKRKGTKGKKSKKSKKCKSKKRKSRSSRK